MKQILQNIFAILSQREKQKLWRLSVLNFLISVLDIGFLIALLFVLNFYTRSGRIYPSGSVSAELLNKHPVLLITCFTLLFAIKNILGFFITRMEYNFVYDVASRISRDNLARYLNGSYYDYVNIDSSVINRRISQQPIEFSHYVLNGVQQILTQVLLIAITIISIFIINPALFLLLVLILTPPVFLVGWLMKQKLDALRQYGKKTGEKAIQYLQEALSSYIESNVYLKKEFFIERYHRFQVQLNHYLAGRLVVQSLPLRLIEVFAVFGLFVLILMNYFTAGNNTIPLVTVGALMIAAYKIIPGIVKITNLTGQIKTYAYAAADLVSPQQLNVKDDYLSDPVSTVVFENVSFSYSGKCVLNNFSLAIGKSDVVGISGMSGRGKTTLVNLLLGFLTPDAGSIYFNGRETNAKNRHTFWSRIAYIKQQPFLLHTSIIENITLQENGYDTGKLNDIISLTGIDKLIDTFPLGLKTVITENGKNLSGGQRQRIIFARALYKDFDLLILDEPFNELDETTEMEMLELLRRISAQGKIILLITHHSAALSFCNRKVLMDE